jgi:hypothetical protein
MKQYQENSWQFFIKDIKNSQKTATKPPHINGFSNKELIHLFQSNDTNKLTQFAENIKTKAPLTINKLANLCLVLSQWTLSLGPLKDQEVNEDLYDVMSTISTFTIDQFNALQENQIFQNESVNFGLVVYNLAILSRACLKTPALSARVLNNIGILVEKKEQMNSTCIVNFISGLGLLAKNQCIDSLQLNTTTLEQLLTLLITFSWNNLTSKEIAKCLYGLGLIARTQFLNDFKPDMMVLQSLMTILIHLPLNRCAIETSLYSLMLLVEFGHLDEDAVNTMVLRTLRAFNGHDIQDKETPFLADENHEQYLEHLGLSSSSQLSVSQDSDSSDPFSERRNAFTG